MNRTLAFRCLAAGSLASTLLLSGCSSQRMAGFGAFATAGSRYADAMVSLTDAAGSAVIDTDSDILLNIRDGLSQGERRQQYRDHTAALKGLLAQQRELLRHTRLLKEYFASLAEMAGSGEEDQIGTKAQSIADSIRKLPSLAGSGKNPAKSGITQATAAATPLVVGTFRRKALEEELRRNGATIERELELQRDALALIAVQMRSDIAVAAEIREYAMVTRPYSSSGTLPDTWKTNRRESLNLPPTLAALEAATCAAERLRGSFRKVVNGQLTVDNLDGLIHEIELIGSALGRS